MLSMHQENTKTNETHAFATIPFVQRDLGGPVVERPRHKDLLASPSPAENCGPGLSSVLTVTLQVSLPCQKLLDLLWSLANSIYRDIKHVSDVTGQNQTFCLFKSSINLLLLSFSCTTPVNSETGVICYQLHVCMFPSLTISLPLHLPCGKCHHPQCCPS